LEQVATVAGVSFEGLTGVITRFSARLPSIEGGGSEAAEAFRRLGVDLRDTSGEIRDMDDLFPDLIMALQNIENVTERNALAQQVFGRSLNDLAPVLGMTAEEFQNARDEAHDLGLVLGADALNSANAYRISLDTLGSQVQALWRDLAVDLIPLIVDTVVPAFQRILEGVRSAVTWFTNLDDSTKVLVGTIAAIAAAIGPALLAIGGMIKIFQTLSTVVRGVGALFNIATLTSPVGLIMIAVAAIAAATYLIMTNWDEIKAFFERLWAAVVSIFNNAISWIKDFLTTNWETIVSVIGGPIGRAVVLITRHWDDIKEVFRTALDFIVNLVGRIREELTSRLALVIEPVRKIADGVADVFSWLSDKLVGNSIVPDMVEAILGEWSRLEDGTIETFDRMSRKVYADMTELTGNLETIWDGYYENLLANEELTDKERVALMRKQAQAQKNFAIFQVVLDTAAAVIKMLANPGGVVGVVMSAAALAAGIARLAAIRAAPLPQLAMGGIARATPGGRDVTVAEGGTDEAIVPLDRLGEFVSDIGGAVGGASDMHVIVNLDGRPIIDTIGRAMRNGSLLVNARAVV
jgi:DNA-binding Lrp family transcriptional regulator